MLIMANFSEPIGPSEMEESICRTYLPIAMAAILKKDYHPHDLLLTFCEGDIIQF